jgi:hypothetical protein
MLSPLLVGFYRCVVSSAVPERPSRGIEGSRWRVASETGARVPIMLGVVGIGVLAVGLRFWRVDWGLAQGAYFPDENLWIERMRGFFPLGWTSLAPGGRLYYPTMYSSLAGLAAWALGVVPAPGDPAQAPALLLVARFVSALASLVTVLAVGLATGRVAGTRVALVAALLMAVAPIEVMQVHFASVDALLVLWMTVAAIAACVVASTGSLAAVVVGGVAAGFAVGTKYTGLAALMGLGWGILEHAWKRRSGSRAFGLAAIALMVGAVAALVASPVLVTRAGDVRREMAFLNWTVMRGGPNNNIVESLGSYGRPLVYQAVVGLPFALGWSFYVAGLVGIAVAVARRTPVDRVMLAAIIPYFLIVSSGYGIAHRYAMPLVPVLAVLAARALLDGRVWPTIRVGLVLVVVVHTFVYSASLLTRLSYDQQEALARWLPEHVPRASHAAPVRVEMPRAMSLYSGLGGFLASRGILPAQTEAGRWLETRPEAFVLPEWVAIYVRRTPPSAAALRQLEDLEAGRSGYREVARWAPSWFLHDGIYAWLDPALRTTWPGRTGFRVFVPTE